jgi:methionine-rich copper-binding protein CopC
MRGNLLYRTALQVIALLSALWMNSGLACAHAVVIDSSPKNGETLFSPPRKVVLRFNAKIEESLSRATLFLAGGTTIPLGLSVFWQY